MGGIEKRFKSFNLCLLRGFCSGGQRFESDPNLRVQILKNIVIQVQRGLITRSLPKSTWTLVEHFHS